MILYSKYIIILLPFINISSGVNHMENTLKELEEWVIRLGQDWVKHFTTSSKIDKIAAV
mgnify:CR=1 FL=1